jgi:LPXTG-site transpeptidase (sortase) family protein
MARHSGPPRANRSADSAIAEITPIRILFLDKFHLPFLEPPRLSQANAMIDEAVRGGVIVAAHRDTQFRFLGDLVSGDRIAAQTIDGRLLAYRVSAARIVRADASGLDPADAGPGGARLALVTCYPFTGVLHSPWRYVVIADRYDAD